MKKTIFSLFLLLILLVVPVFAEEIEDVSGEGDGPGCGDGMSWFVDGTVLTISGSGEMYDFEKGKTPWQDFQNTLTKVVFEGEITQIGDYSFMDFDKLVSIDFGDDLIRIGKYAFSSCDGLTSVSLPKTFKKFGERCFSSCAKLTEIHCAGTFPRFDDSCLWDTYCKIYFPKEAPWSVILIEDLENAFGGRIEFLASDGSDPYTPTEATTAPTEVEAEPVTTAPETTTQEATVPTTQETTVPQEPTVPVTEETVTEPEPTQETFLMGDAETTQAPTQAPKPAGIKGSTMGLLLVVSTLAILGLGALIFRALNRRD